VGTNSGVYKLLLVLHILSAIVGFGTVFLNGLYGAQVKKRRGPEGLAISEANFFVSEVAGFFIYAVFVLGILLVLVSDDAWDFSQTWVWLAMAIYIVALGVAQGLLRPNVKRMQALSAELIAAGPPSGTPTGPPPQAVEIEQRAKVVAACGATLNVAVVAVLALMIWKPGA
jgi:uncharacterized membrane protein